MYEKISLLISGHSNQIHTTYIPFHSIPNDRKKIYLFSIQTLSRSGFVQIIPVLKPKPIYRYWILENNVSVQHILNSRNMLWPWITVHLYLYHLVLYGHWLNIPNIRWTSGEFVIFYFNRPNGNKQSDEMKMKQFTWIGWDLIESILLIKLKQVNGKWQ